MAKFQLGQFVNVLLALAVMAVLATEITGAVTSQADLAVTSITVDPVNPVSYKPTGLVNAPPPAIITIKVENQGSLKSGATELDVEIFGNEGLTKYRLPVEAIPAGETLAVTVEHYFEHPGSLPIDVTVDLFNRVAESDEDNNEYSVHVEVI